MTAAIPYTTHPGIDLGFMELRTFGVLVAVGVLIGIWFAAVYGEHFGMARDVTYRLATTMVLGGVVGARLTWALTHTESIDNPIDVIAVWDGGLQFSGGFITAVLVGFPTYRRWSKLLRWQVLDGYALGLTIGLAIGRIGCYAVGEHFGKTTEFFLGTRYDGGEVREPSLGSVRLAEGTVFHNTSLYEFLYVLALFGAMVLLVRRSRARGHEVVPGTLVGVFVLVYGLARFLSDALRVNDERVASLTGAQWMCLALVPLGLWVLMYVRPQMSRLAFEHDIALDASAAPDEVEAPDGT